MINKEKEANIPLYWKFNQEDNMMYEKPKPWDGDGSEFGGKGDSLWETSIAYITYGDADLKNSILKCFRKFSMIDKNGYLYQASRASNRYGEDDVSRDQVILALTALKYNNDIDELIEIINHLPYKLSRRFTMTPTMWMWIKQLPTNNTFFATLFNIFLFFELIVAIPLTKSFRYFAGVDKSMPIGQYISKDKRKEIMFRIFNTIKFPGFALHLYAWQIFTTKNIPILSWINKKIMLLDVEDDNYLLQMLLGNKVDIKLIDEYKSTTNWRPSGRLNGCQYFDAWYLNDDEVKYNQLDKDIQYRIRQK